jgi:hypothetical protein
MLELCTCSYNIITLIIFDSIGYLASAHIFKAKSCINYSYTYQLNPIEIKLYITIRIHYIHVLGIRTRATDYIVLLARHSSNEYTYKKYKKDTKNNLKKVAISATKELLCR